MKTKLADIAYLLLIALGLLIGEAVMLVATGAMRLSARATRVGVRLMKGSASGEVKAVNYPTPKMSARPPPAKKKVAPKTYPPGYFMAPVRLWMPLFTPHLDKDEAAREQMIERRAKLANQRREEVQKGWGRGTVTMAGTPEIQPPGWLGQNKKKR